MLNDSDDDDGDDDDGGDDVGEVYMQMYVYIISSVRVSVNMYQTNRTMAGCCGSEKKRNLERLIIVDKPARLIIILSFVFVSDSVFVFVFVFVKIK